MRAGVLSVYPSYGEPILRAGPAEVNIYEIETPRCPKGRHLAILEVRRGFSLTQPSTANSTACACAAVRTQVFLRRGFVPRNRRGLLRSASKDGGQRGYSRLMFGRHRASLVYFL